MQEIRKEQEDFLQEDQKEPLLVTLRKRESIRALIIVFGLSFIQKGCGVNIVTYFINDIFAAAKTNLSPELQAIIAGLIEFIMSFVSAATVDKLGRRTLLILSAILMGVSLFSLAIFFIIQNSVSSDVLLSIQWIPVTSLSLYIVAYALGFGSVIFIVRAEICSTEIKGELEAVQKPPINLIPSSSCRLNVDYFWLGSLFHHN